MAPTEDEALQEVVSCTQIYHSKRSIIELNYLTSV